MTSIFVTVLRMSLTASYTALVVIIARLFLKKAPKVFSYALWSVVLFRLVFLFSFESTISLIPRKTEIIPYAIINSPESYIYAGTELTNKAINQSIQQTILSVNSSVSLKTPVALIEIGTIIWIIGILVIISYGVISYFRLKDNLSTAILVKENIFKTDHIQTPFVLGFIKPGIYIPTELSGSELDYIIKHEEIHIRRFDYIIKPIAFIALTLHWFNPVIWLSYFLMAKDMEMSCDESVMKESSNDIRIKYSNSLLSLSVKQSGLLTPLAFGEGNVKSRIRNILNYKKPGFWLIAVAAALVCVVVIGLAANPRESINTGKTDGEALLNENFDLESLKAKAMLFTTNETDLLKIGEDGFEHYYSTFMGENVPKEYRITKFKLNEISLLAGDAKEFCVDIISDYSTTGLYFLSANGNFIPNGTGGDCEGNYSEFRIKSLGNNEYEIVSVGTGGGAQGLEPVEQYYAFDVVNFSDGMVEIDGEKLSFENVDLAQLYETLTPKQVEQMMYRAVIYYKIAYQKDITALGQFSSSDLKNEIEKWNKNGKTTPGIYEIMNLDKFTDVTFPIGIAAPFKKDKNYGVVLTLDKIKRAIVMFEIYDDGTPLVTEFIIVISPDSKN